MSLTSDKYFSDSELESVRETLRLLSLNKKNERDVLLFELAIATGARESELLRLESKSFQASTKSVLVIGLKGSNKREIPLPVELFDRAFKFASRQKGLMFPISDSRVRQIWGSIRPVNKKFHAFRHTLGRLLYAKTKDILFVKRILGHKSVANTAIYTETDSTPDAMRQVMYG